MPTDERKPLPAEVIEILKPKVAVVAEVPQGREMRLSAAEVDALRELLDRDRTAKVVHGGLKGLLSLSDDDVAALLGFLKRATSK